MNIEQALADCLQEIEEKGATPQECLSRYPELREELAPLLALALRLRQASQVNLPEKSQREMRLRLMRLPLPQTEVKPVFFPRMVWQMARVLVVLTLAFLTLGAGLALASEGSIPGDTLYPLKRTLEEVALSLAPSPETEASLRLVFAERRLQEATSLAQRGEGEIAQQLVNEYRGELEAVLRLIPQEQVPSGEEASITNALQDHLQRQESLLFEVRRRISMENLGAIDQALSTIQELSGALDQIQEGTPSPFPGLEVTPSLPSPTPTSLPSTPLPLPTITPVLPLPTITIG